MIRKGFQMLCPTFLKYGFRIRTRDGMVVDNLTIQGRDEEDAERKLRQMYRECEVLDRSCRQGAARMSAANFEEVVSLITR